MRLAPVAIYFRSSPSDALQNAAFQSRATHRSDEAAECARLLAHIILVAMSHPSGGASARVEVLGELHDSFTSNVYAVNCLAASAAEERVGENKGSELAVRDWRWKKSEYRYPSSRIAQDP